MFALKDLVAKGKLVRFVRIVADSLWYETENGFAFPVPLSETHGATFLAEDKALLFMRHIRKNLAADGTAISTMPPVPAPAADVPVVHFSHFNAMEMWFTANDGVKFPVAVTAGATISNAEPAARFAAFEQAYRDSIIREQAARLVA